MIYNTFVERRLKMEKKEYEYKGTVTISTEEYKDLITDKFSAQNEIEDYRRRYWDEQNTVSELKDKIEALEMDQKNYRDFVNSSPEITNFYKQWLINKQDDEI